MAGETPQNQCRPLRIGIGAPYDLGRDGGVNTHIRAQARALRSRGHDVSVFGASSSPLAGGERALSACISPVIGGTETGFGIDPRAWWRVAALLRSARFDILHLHEPLMPLVPWCALWQARVPVVATFHTHRESGHRWYGRYHWLLDPLMRRIDARLAVSEAARRTVARDFPASYEIVPNAIEVARFQQPAARPGTMAADQAFVLHVGRLEPRKGVDRLIRAMSIVRQERPDATLAIVGDGPDRPALEALAARLGVAASFTGRVSEAELPSYYRAAQLVCAPALGDESFGIVLLEAMAAGRPIVATRIEGYAELLQGAGSARLVAVDDTAALAREIVALLNEPEARHALGSRGAAFVARYDWSVVAERLESIYRGLLSSRTPRHETNHGVNR
jgi:phosphatidyl-myo-inositol alpha-mannosyltransferase